MVKLLRCFLLLGFGLFILASPVHAEFLFDYVGYDYASPNGPAGLGDPLNQYESVGFVNSLNGAYLSGDYGTNEYTYHLWAGPAPAQIDTVAGIFIMYDYDGGTLTVFEDPIGGGTPGVYGTNPQNGTSPSSFSDGTVILGGSFSSFRVTVNITTGVGSFSGDLDWDSGTQLSNIPSPERTGWTFAGLGSNVPGIPPGYISQVDGEAYKEDATSTQSTSWGDIKSKFR